MAAVRTAGWDVEDTAHVDVADLARAHWGRERVEPGTEEWHEADMHYAAVRSVFQHQHGDIVSEYWATYSPSGAVLTVPRLQRRSSRFSARYSPEVHRATDWRRLDDEAEAVAAAVFRRCDVIAIRAGGSLSAVPLRVAMHSIFATVAYTLARLDRPPGQPQVARSGVSPTADQFSETSKELERLERYVEAAEQYAAIRRYYIGALVGLAAILLTTLAAELAASLTPFRDAAAASVAAGAVGAVVAATQRAASRRFSPPSEIGPTVLFVIGALGTAIGAVFGTVAFLTVKSIEIVFDLSPPTELFAIAAFLTGFAARWMQLVLERSPGDLGEPAAQRALEAIDRLPETVEASVRATLRGKPLANYDGWLTVEVLRDSRRVPIALDRRVSLIVQQPYEVVAHIGQGSVGELSVPLTITSGIDEPEVEFSVELDSDRPSLRRAAQTVRVDSRSGAARVVFPVALSGEEEASPWLWVRVEQRQRTIQSLELVALPAHSGP